ncbi:hypothetical protein Y032_0928g3079 [Ancylostoma ceylanicum]|uniref:Uncharacterized protein n=1 Tax=Ancylostoma ceylanicum TaxID=53326 RepID=A0A016WAY7_9BILA|nr:hypothetical protein Y032_0928g3079 [Ancylostoma ceylanicum]
MKPPISCTQLPEQRMQCLREDHSTAVNGAKPTVEAHARLSSKVLGPYPMYFIQSDKHAIADMLQWFRESAI